jgi:hypothetical protein
MTKPTVSPNGIVSPINYGSDENHPLTLDSKGTPMVRIHDETEEGLVS